MHASRLFTAAAAICLVGAAQASPLFSHPAMAVASGTSTTQDFMPVIVGHPSSPRWKMPHAGFDHPAVQVAQQAAQGFDANRFIVQPPASTRWTLGPAPDVLLVAASK